MNYQVALKRLSTADRCSLVMFALIISLLMVPKGRVGIALGIFMVYLLLMVACHVLVGLAARAAGKSWLVYGVLPIVWPHLGVQVASLLLAKEVKAAARLEARQSGAA
jgi:hypothetical protein